MQSAVVKMMFWRVLPSNNAKSAANVLAGTILFATIQLPSPGKTRYCAIAVITPIAARKVTEVARARPGGVITMGRGRTGEDARFQAKIR